MSLVIAIDGPSGVGKSSTSKELARRLNLAYLDTGAMYRAVAVAFKNSGLASDDAAGIADLVAHSKIAISTDPNRPRVSIDGRDVTKSIRDPETSAIVSAVAVVPKAREILTAKMREIIAAHGRRIVVEGRDITTVVAPDAELRLLLTADPKVRIGRRAGQLRDVDAETISDSILRRDRDDSTVSNFTAAADGVITIDSTHLSLEEVVEAILELVPDE